MRNFAQQRAIFDKEEDEKEQKNASSTTTATAATDVASVSEYGDRNLYEEMRVMFELSSLIYAVAYLLELVGKGGYPDPNATKSSSSSWWSWGSNKEPQLKQFEKTDLVIDDKDCSTEPDTTCVVKLRRQIPADSILQFIDANQDALSQDPEITGDVPEEESEKATHPRTRLVASALRTIRNGEDESLLWCFDHHFGAQSLVYGITVNRSIKRVTIVFRGSSTSNDWYQNAQMLQKPVDKSGLLVELGYPADKDVMVHTGFHNYLFDDELKNKSLTMEQMKEINRGGRGKYSQILEDLEEIYKYQDPSSGEYVHKGFHLYVSGHSLGGALSHLLAMKLACSQTVKDIGFIPKPIINVSVASPYVGDESFAQAVRLLEEKNWLRHIRVTNEGDVVPVIPPKHFVWNWMYAPYVHTGLNIHLVPSPTDDGGNDASKNQQEREIGFNVVRTFYSQFTVSSGERHKVSDYWTRQDADRAFFEGSTIGQLYTKYWKKGEEADEE